MSTEMLLLLACADGPVSITPLSELVSVDCIRSALNDGLISRDTSFSDSHHYSITPAGRARLASLLDQARAISSQDVLQRRALRFSDQQHTQDVAYHAAEQQSNEEKQRLLRNKDIHRSWWQFSLGILIGWILGCFTPVDLLNWFSSLF